MMPSDDAELRQAFAEWFAHRPKTIPARSQRVLERAERRLIGSIKHREVQAKLETNAERVRQAQLGCLKAKEVASGLPTDVDDAELQRQHANLAKFTAVWERMSVEDIIDLYSSTLGVKQT